MKTVIIKNQEEFDKIKEVKADEEVIFEANEIEINCKLEVWGVLKLVGKIKSSWNNKYIEAWENSTPHIVARENSTPHIVARENSTPHIEAWENSTPHIEAWENSTPHIEAWENSTPHIVARENSTPHIVAWENSTPHIVAWENSTPHIVARENSTPHIEAWENSTPHIEAWENSTPHIEAWENSTPHIVARENSVIMGMKLSIKSILSLFGFASAIIPFDLKIDIKKSKTAHVQYVQPQDWFERNGINKYEKITLYKRVSRDFKTQEETANETQWIVGSIVKHPNWHPTVNECVEGKFHGCSKPYFCDEFRNKTDDKYIAIEVKSKDLFEWKDNPQYPHKIGFRKAEVLYECDRYGNKKE